MAKNWPLKQKQPFFDRLPEQMQRKGENSVLPILQLFKKLIHEETERSDWEKEFPEDGIDAEDKIIAGKHWNKLLPKIKNPNKDLTFWLVSTIHQPYLTITILVGRAI